MPPEDRRTLLEFFQQALVHKGALNTARARVQAGYLLAQLLSLDPAALKETIALCEQAETWGGNWPGTALRVRRAVSRFYTLQPGYSLGPTRTRFPEPQTEGGDRPNEAERAQNAEPDPRIPETTDAPALENAEAVENLVRKEVERLEDLEQWRQQGPHSLEDLMDLWEPPDGPAD